MRFMTRPASATRSLSAFDRRQPGATIAAFCAVAFTLAAAQGAHAQAACDADFNADGVVDSADLGTLLSSWGPCGACAADIDRNGAVDSADLGALLTLWNATCTRLPWATVLEQSPNPAVVTNGALRQAIAATGLPWRVRDNLTNIEMVLIPPGSFVMGCSASNAAACSGVESPLHAVTLTNAFYLGRYEVTQAQWATRVGSNPRFFTSASAQVPAKQVPNRPVEQVSWNSVQGFVGSSGLRLPTEAEWEYAYRAGTTTAFHAMAGYPSGTNDDNQVVNIAVFSWNAAQTLPVGSKQPNGFGLHDMAGNVWEWVNDYWSVDYYASSPSTNPPGPATGSDRVTRGGSWFNPTFSVRSSMRFYATPATVARTVGFRVARNP